MSTPKRFSDHGIKAASSKALSGDKIKIEKVIDKEIIIHDYRIEKSKYQDKGEFCLHLQIWYKDEMHVLFTGAKGFIETMRQTSREILPIATKIIKQDKHLEFT
jgi:hypothetical protein